MATDLILACHGQSAQRENNRLLGWWADVPLSPLGQKQALLLGERLQRDFDIRSLYTSPLCRARETADIVGDMVKVVPVPEPGLRELDSGMLAKLSYGEAKARFPDLIVHGTLPADGRIPGGESYEDLHHRTAWAVDRIVRQAANRQVAIVTHGGPIGAYLRAFMGYTPEQKNCPHFVCNVASLHHLKIDTEGECTVVRLNDTEHLSGMPV